MTRIIKIVPCKRFRGSWTADEGDGVVPAYKEKQQAIGYAKTRFGGFQEGEIHVYGGEVVEVIKMKGGSQYGQSLGSSAPSPEHFR